MKNSYFLIFLALLMTSCHKPIETETFRADNPKIEWVGRNITYDDGSISFDWSGSYMTCRFTGNYFAITASDTKQNYYNVWIDGVEQDGFSTHGKDSLIVLATELKHGDHTIVIQKRSEAEQGRTTIHNIMLDKGAELLDIESSPSRHIEFIGDSLTCGFGTEGESREEPFMAKTENCDKAFGCIVARYFDASYTLIAHSGMGVSRNYGEPNSTSKITMGDRMLYTFDEDSTHKWSFDRHIPDVVVINLGSNDFSTKPHPSRREFSDGYRDIINNLRHFYGDVPILCVAPRVEDPAFSHIRSFCNELDDSNIHFTALFSKYCNNTTDLGSSWHPNYEGQIKMSMLLIPYISTIMEWDMDRQIIQ